MVKYQKFIYNNRFSGMPKQTDFKFIEEELPYVNDGEIHCKAIALSVDPYMRLIGQTLNEGFVMVGSQIAVIKQSKNLKYKVGQHIIGEFGWQTDFVGDPDKLKEHSGGVFLEPRFLPDLQGSYLTYGLGVFGLTGNAAYFGLLEICRPIAGEYVAITAAAGAVGSIAGQIAKIRGCKVVGFTGSDGKVDWLKNELKYDFAFNYNKVDVTKTLKEIAPGGINCFFDNVGGQISYDIISGMAEYGRIAVCGAISAYNQDPPQMVGQIQLNLALKQIKVEGFSVKRWRDRFNEGISQMMRWRREGRLIVRETVTKGFINMPDAFIKMLEGENYGKSIVVI